MYTGIDRTKIMGLHSVQRVAFVTMKRYQIKTQTTELLFGMKHMLEKPTNKCVSLVLKVQKLPDTVALEDG